jgi:polysaccharide export outer membrane protein
MDLNSQIPAEASGPQAYQSNRSFCLLQESSPTVFPGQFRFPHARLASRRRYCRRLVAAAAVGLMHTVAVFEGQQAVRAESVQRPATAPPARAAVSVVNQDAYILGPGDQVQLTLLDPGAEGLNGAFDILNDGSTSLALVGNVVLDGLSLNQATSWLQSLYGQYLLRPELNLRVVRPRPLQVSVIGEVENPGLYSLTPSEVSQTGVATSISGLPTVVAALQKAGGLTLNADLSNVLLQRRIPGNGQQLRETRLDLIALLKLGDKMQNPFLFDGDTLLIGKALIPDGEVMELAATNLSPPSIRVNVIGELVSPGTLTLQANTPLIQAILAAGGPKTWRAKRSDVELVRISRNGAATRELFTIDYSQGVSGIRNPPLRDGDTVVVNRSNYAVFTDALDAVTSPLVGLVNAWGLVQLVRDNNSN